jgi:small subunit ribosomal protein S1
MSSLSVTIEEGLGRGLGQKEKSRIDQNSNSFEDLLNEYHYQQPKRGQILDGEIVLIDDEAIILDVGLKRDAIVTNREIRNLDEETLENLAVGDEIPLHVMRTPIGDENLLVSIERALEHQSWKKADSLLEQGHSVALEIIGSNRGGLLVQFDRLEGFVPNSQIPDVRRVRDRSKRREIKDNLIGSKLLAKPIEVRRRNRRLIFSALAAERERRQRRLQELEEGSVIQGRVVSIVDFGAFVDLDGVDGLVHISELDWGAVEHPSEVLSVGDEIEVKILKVDLDRERVELSRKELLPSPWEMVEDTYQPGDLMEVKITDVVDFGAFGELPEGVQGLIHISEIGYTAPESSQDVLEEGKPVLVRVLNVDAERERISLSMRKVPMEKQLDWMLETEDILS